MELCHCKMCRRWGGGLPLTGVQVRQVTMAAESPLTWWRSSPWGERGFCSVCGSSLFWRGTDEEQTVWQVATGALDDEETLTLKEHIFYDEKAAFYQLGDSAPRLRGTECTAQALIERQAQYGEGYTARLLAQLREYNGAAFADEVKQLMAASAG